MIKQHYSLQFYNSMVSMQVTAKYKYNMSIKQAA